MFELVEGEDDMSKLGPFLEFPVVYIEARDVGQGI